MPGSATDPLRPGRDEARGQGPWAALPVHQAELTTRQACPSGLLASSRFLLNQEETPAVVS